jgi:hypothetical protein
MLRILFFVLLLTCHTSVLSELLNRPQWTMSITTSNAPYRQQPAPVVSYSADEADGTLWLQSQLGNDVWSSNNLGMNWEFRSGVFSEGTYKQLSEFPNASYNFLSNSGGCSDSQSNRYIRIGGYDGRTLTNSVWTSNNLTHWQMQPAHGLLPQLFTSCVH